MDLRRGIKAEQNISKHSAISLAFFLLQALPNMAIVAHREPLTRLL